ncbi:SDR family NAD(P)-dependent oxidoreductase [Actibacterium sp. D379-3]
MKRFEDKTVIVTGAGSGIGRATALAFAAEGARLVATDVNPSGLDALSGAVGAARVETVVGDITLEETAQNIMAATDGRVDVLANVAGIMDGFLPVGEVDDATWSKVFAVNLTGPMRLMRAVLPVMAAAGKGVIVNVASEAGLRGSAAGAAYTASKHALIGLTKNTAYLYAPQGIRVNAVAPGPVDTGMDAPMKSQLAAERVGALMELILPPSARPETLASNILWLASDDAENINGIVLASDGGWSAI